VKIAVVIPVLDEVEQISGAIASVMRGNVGAAPGSAIRGRNLDADPGTDSGADPGTDPGPEVLVVDGGSRDGTAERARELGARVLTSPRGRARQLEAGWRASAGEVVVFLHADTRLEAGWEGALRGALVDPGVVGGAFRLRFDAPGVVFRWVESIVSMRVRLFSLPYGDQAIFVRRSILSAMGGVPAVEIMEDLDLVRELNRRGAVVALRPAAITSARRYCDRGLVGTLFRNALGLAAWRLGVGRTRIARWVGR
jgi:rSAM/selenodomain-associated transferase 2